MQARYQRDDQLGYCDTIHRHYLSTPREGKQTTRSPSDSAILITAALHAAFQQRNLSNVWLPPARSSLFGTCGHLLSISHFVPPCRHSVRQLSQRNTKAARTVHTASTISQFWRSCRCARSVLAPWGRCRGPIIRD